MTTTMKAKPKTKAKSSRSTFTGVKKLIPKVVEVKEDVPLRIDIGCGKNKRQDGKWVGLDEIAFEGVDFVLDAGKDRWPFEDESVTEAYASHFVEHLVPNQRIHFVNELYRVMKKPKYDNGKLLEGMATIIVPHWASQRAYGDLTHAWPPVSEFWFYYLDKEWRAVNAPHNLLYTCDFNCSWGYNEHHELNGRNIEYKQHAMKFWKEACTDTIAYFYKK